MKLLVVVDMQVDFVNGSLGTIEAEAIVPGVVDKIRNWQGKILATRDTHKENYLSTSEGKNLPVIHCVVGTPGHKIVPEVENILMNNAKLYAIVNKPTFGSAELVERVRELVNMYGEENIEEIQLVGLCTDICVISNALLLKANFYEIPISVDSACCAGVTPETHEAALTTMKMCQINVI